MREGLSQFWLVLWWYISFVVPVSDTARNSKQVTNINIRVTNINIRVAMAEWLARQTPNHKFMGSSAAKNQLAQKPSRMGYGWEQWCLGSLSRKWVPGYRQICQLYLDYPWRLEGSWAGD